jgi:ribosomal protein S18 acetylase RimI-like enzyme
LNDWLDQITTNGHHLVAATDDGSIIGHVMLVPIEPGTVELASFVHQSARGQGLGTALARAAVQLARQHEYRRAWLSVEPSNRAAVRSYARAGFTRVPDSIWAPELEMAIDLAPLPISTPAREIRPSA